MTEPTADLCGRWGARCQWHLLSADRAGGETLNPWRIPDAEDGVRWNQKKVRWTFFPPNRPTSHLWRGDLEPRVQEAQPLGNKKSIPFGMLFLFLMRKMGLEPTRYCYHRHLKPARLPIPPLPRTAFRIISFI